MQTVTEKLNKTLNTINNHIDRTGGRTGNQRAAELKWRYDDLKDQAKETGEWDTYCESKGFHKSHNSGDCFA